MKCDNCSKFGHISPECMVTCKELHKDSHESSHIIKEIEPSIDDEFEVATVASFLDLDLESDDESLDLNFNRMCLAPGECNNGNAANAHEFSK